MTTFADRVGGKDRVIGGPFGSNLTQKDYRPEGVPVIRGTNMGYDGRWIGGEYVFVSPGKVAKDLSTNLARRGDIIVTQRGTLGQVSIVPLTSQHEVYVISQSQMAVSVAPDCADPLFVYYYLRSPAFVAYLENTTIQTGVPHINLGLLRKTPVDWPDVPMQIRIGQILGSLDDKIELNRRMNETLEAMAQAIFRDWFVDFGPVRRKLDGVTDPAEIMGGLVSDLDRARELAELFPPKLGDDGLPEGWVERKLDEIASQHNATLTPLGHPTELFDHYSIPSFDKERNPTTELGAAILSNKTLVPSNAVLLSKLNPEIARVWLPNKNARHREICSTEFLAYTSKEPFGRALLYALFSSDPFRTLLCGMVTGTSKSHQRVSPKALAQRETLAVRGPEAGQFEAVVGPLLDQVLHNRDENRTLAATRDLLLPKLMSGEIRIRDAEAALEAAQ